MLWPHLYFQLPSSSTQLSDEEINDLLRQVEQLGGDLESAQDQLQQCRAGTQELNADLQAAAILEAKLSSKVSGLQVAIDRFRRGKQSCVSELGTRAAENDEMARKLRKLRKKDLNTLHHGLHWMWRSEAAGKERDDVMKMLKEMLSKLEEQKGSDMGTTILAVIGILQNVMTRFAKS